MTTTPRETQTPSDLQQRIAALSPRQQELLLSRLRENRKPDPARAEAAIVRRPTNRAPLSYAQHRLWFVDQLDPGTPHYNVAIAVPVRGMVKVDVLQQAVDDVVRRHEALRTTFELDDETPVQVIHERVEVPLDVIDLQQVDAADRDTAIQDAVGTFSRQPYDLAVGPLVRVALLRLGEQDHILAIAMHHIVSDARSMEIMLRELGMTYEATRRGLTGMLPEPALQYADFALWQRERLQGEVLEKQTDYWRHQLAGELPPLQLPVDRPRPAEPQFTGAQRLHNLPADVSHRLHQLCTEERTTPFALFVTAISVLLHRYCGQNDIVVGAPVSNRARTELEGTVGYLGNTLGLRADLSGDPTFREALRRNHKVVFDAFANQDLPFDKVVELAQPERDLNRTPLVQVMFVYHWDDDRPEDGAGGGDLSIGSPLVIDNGTSKFDLTFSIRHRDGASYLALEHSTELFDTETIDRLIGHWERLLTAAAADPDVPIGRLPLLTGPERHTMLVDWNATSTVFPDKSCLHELIERRAAATPDAIAAADRERTLSYRELDERANQLAHHLRELGAGPDIPVAVCLDKSTDVAVALLGTLKAGSPYLPLDPAAPAGRTAHMLTEAAVPVLLTRAGLDRRSAEGGEPTMKTVFVDDDWPVIARQPNTKPATSVTADDLAYVIYTSGSTGSPKGVMVDHRGRVNNFHDFNTRFAIGEGDAVLALAALTFDMSAYDVLGTLMCGARIVFPDAGAERDPAHWLTLMTAERVTVWHSVPALLEMLVEYLETDGATLPDLRLVLLGGDWVPPTLPARIRAVAPGAQIIVMGGATEVSMDSTITEIEALDAAIPYGKPMANQRAYVLDTNLQPVPVGVAGELYLAGVGVGRGYLANPELTAAKFLDSPLPEEPGRIYRTGDLARYRADGNLELLGRADFQIKIRGWRIEPGEIQSVLRDHPAVKDCLVVAQTADNGTKRLVGYLLAADAEPDIADVRSWAEQRLPDYMVPAALVVLDRLPLTANGKVDMRNLPQPTATETPLVEPRTPVEHALADIWRDLLAENRIGIDDNFFSLGGDSIKTIQTIARAKKKGLQLTPRQLFQYQTIRELAAVARSVEESASSLAESLLPAELIDKLRAEHADFEDAYPLPPMQRVMFEHAVNEPPEGIYIIHADYLFNPGGLEPELLVQAWQQIIDRYPVLRTTFHWQDLDEPVQVVHRSAEVVVERHDLRGLSVEEQVRRQDEIVAEDRRRGYDLTRAPLVRLFLLRLDGDGYKYISSNHHIVLDGWSRAIVQQEVFAAYEALRRGESAELPPFRPFRDYIGWVREQDLVRAREVWQPYLEGFTEPTPLVAARGLPSPSRVGPFAKQSIALDPDIAGRLDRFTRTHPVTSNTLMQAAWSLLMCRYTGRDDVVLGVISSGRTTELDDIDTIVGLCVNALPVRTRVDRQEPLLPFLVRQQQEQVELRELDFTPLSAVSGMLGIDGVPFETIMVYENYPWDGSLLGLADRVSFDHPLCQQDYQLAQFEYALRVEVAPGIPLLIMHYYTDSFTDAVISGMLADWAEMIDRMVRTPGQPVGDLL